MERRTLRVAMDEILDAMTMSEDDPICFFLDLETGRVESRVSPDVFGDLGEDDDDFDRRLEEDSDRFEEIPKYQVRIGVKVLPLSASNRDPGGRCESSISVAG